jgi:hypothetical protein
LSAKTGCPANRRQLRRFDRGARRQGVIGVTALQPLARYSTKAENECATGSASAV